MEERRRYMLTEQDIKSPTWRSREGHPGTWDWLEKGVIVEYGRGDRVEYPCSFDMGEYENGEYQGRRFYPDSEE